MDSKDKNCMTLNQIQIKLFDICGDYKQIIQSIYRSPNISQKHNMEYLEEQTTDVIDKALEILKPKQKTDPVSEQQAKSCLLIISKLQNEAQHLLNEIKRRRLTFNASMNENKRVFQQSIDSLFEKYSKERKTEIEKFSKNIKKLKIELQDIQENFETRLKAQIGLVIYEKDEFLSQFKSLKEKFNSVRSKFESEIQISKEKSDKLTQELKELEESNITLLKKIEDDYSNKMKTAKQKVSSKISELEKTNDFLKKELREKTAEHEEKIKEIKGKIDEKIKENEMDLETKIKNKQNELDLKLNEFEESQKRIENELLKKYNDQKSLNLKTIESLHLVLESLNDRVNEMESKTHEKLRIIQEQNDLRVNEKEQEKKLFFKKQKIEIDELRHQKEEEIQFESDQNDKMYRKIEKELIDVANDIEKQKIGLESQIKNLIRTKNEIEKKIFDAIKRQLMNFSTHTSTIIDITSQDNIISNIGFLNTDEISERFQRFDSISNQKQLELRDLKLSKKNELISYKKESNELIQYEEGMSVAVSDEINSKTIRFEKNSLKIKELLKLHQIEENKSKKEFLTKIKMQKDVIRQCKEELQRLKIDDSKKDQLLLSQTDHRETVKKLNDEIYSIKNQIKIDQVEIPKNMEIEIKNERLFNQKRIQDAQDKLIDVLKKLSAKKIECIDDCEKDQQKWSELRIDIVNSNLKVFSEFSLKSNPNSRPGSSFSRNSLGHLNTIK